METQTQGQAGLPGLVGCRVTDLKQTNQKPAPFQASPGGPGEGRRISCWGLCQMLQGTVAPLPEAPPVQIAAPLLLLPRSLLPGGASGPRTEDLNAALGLEERVSGRRIGAGLQHRRLGCARK